MPEAPKSLADLKALYEEGLAIFRANNLYGIVDHIPTSDEPGFNQEFSYAQYLKQSVNFPNYWPWMQKIISHFDKYNLNFARFEKLLYDIDHRTHSTYPGAIFKRSLDEVERMIFEPKHYEAYQTVTRKPTTYEEVTLHSGRVTQGTRTHQYREKNCLSLLACLWETREFRKPDRTVMHQGELIPFEVIMEKTGIKSFDGIKAAGEAINKSVRLQKIGLRVVFPRNKKCVKLAVFQDTFQQTKNSLLKE